ncbi:A24 family peptidase [Vibrio sp. CAU 1672]|uniref:A24 family peptidase n=1 Tax=Vibrio sp. CAU 1672 TaxID=3032594 RepID=UPI0023DBFB2C|nr:A24 family peptidase [Vibrio sp. CAU 1672]MDF2154434.1 A24 family peptidase [Vibrio sp. CAU 1672]
MIIDIAIWSLLIAIGVSDAQRHRIPNQMVVLLLVLVVTAVATISPADWSEHAYGGIVTFGIGLGLYAIGAMAGGDVKLLAVIGAWLGLEKMGEAVVCIILAGGVVGAFYLALFTIHSGYSVSHQAKGYCLDKVTPNFGRKSKMVIPFAPVIVIGLAYYSYTH